METASADFIVLSRDSETTVASTNFGGVSEFASTTNTNDPFFALFFDSVTHEEPGGNVNTGIWNIGQDSTISDKVIRAEMHSEAIAQQVVGMGSGLLNLNNRFTIEFEVTEETSIELGGSYFGTSDSLFADDFVRIQLQRDNGVVFVNMFLTTEDGLLDVPFEATMVPGTLYRLEVTANANVLGEDTSASGANVCLRAAVLPGDLNQDGFVNLLDVNPFIEALSTGAFQAEADINCDGAVNLLDVNPFIAILSGN